MKSFIKQLVKRALNNTGFDIVPMRKCYKYTFLGLCYTPISSFSEWIKRDGWRNLPSWIRDPIIFIAKKCTRNYIIDKELLRYLVEFYNYDQGYSNVPLSYKDGIKMLKIAFRPVNDLWRLLNPSTDKEVERFYKIVPWYIFAIANTHMLRSYRRFKKRIINECKGDILDYGGGIGDLSAKLAEKGYNVTYLDVQGKTMEFAKWYFKKKGLNIKTIVAKDNIEIPGYYDIIICIEVIEHLVNSKNTLLMIVNHLKKGGKLIITQLYCEGSTESNPMHFRIDFNAEQFLNSLGVYKSEYYPWLWMKK